LESSTLRVAAITRSTSVGLIRQLHALMRMTRRPAPCARREESFACGIDGCNHRIRAPVVIGFIRVFA
jgi:hypothetical protein